MVCSLNTRVAYNYPSPEQKEPSPQSNAEYFHMNSEKERNIQELVLYIDEIEPKSMLAILSIINTIDLPIVQHAYICTLTSDVGVFVLVDDVTKPF